MREMFRPNREECITFFLMALLIWLTNATIAQSQSWERNIYIPGGQSGGALGADIIEVNGKAFVYGTDLIRIYDCSSNNLVDTIIFPEGYGKFNPVYFHYDVYVADFNLMAYNALNSILYVVTPDLRIIGINVNDQGYPRQVMHETPVDISHFKTLNGYNVIKYDQEHNKLYWLVEGRSTELNGIGEFHTRDNYLGIFDVGINGQLTDYYEFFNQGVGANYRNTIFDVEFNELYPRFYVAKMREIEVWDIIDPPQKVQQSISIPTSAGKYSKLLYIRGNDIHKVVAFPYRLPQGNPEELGMEYNVKFHIIDGNDNSVDSILSPSKRIMDAVYNYSDDDLIISYSPNEDYLQTEVVSLNTDIAIYSFNDGFPSYPTSSLLTNTLPPYITDTYPNRPLNLAKWSGNDFLLTKTHEIGKLTESENQYTYIQLFNGINDICYRGITFGNKSFTLSTTIGRMEVLNSDPQIDPLSISLGFPVYYIAANPLEGELYFYNKLNTYNSGFYIYDQLTANSINVNQDTDTGNDILAPVGDLVFNPYQNHILVSENEASPGGTAKIRVLDASTHSLLTVISLQGVEYPKEMFIAENGRLYILANMHVGLTPKLFIYDATAGNNYPAIGTHSLTMPDYDPEFIYYVAHYCYNPDDKAVYLTIKPNDMHLAPYNATPNSMFGYEDMDDYENLNGLFLKLVEDQVNTITDTIELPGEIVFPGDGNSITESLYEKILFVNGRTLNFYNYETDQLTPTDLTINDITYMPYYDKLYGFADEPGFSGTASDRRVVIYRINEDESYDKLNENYLIAGQAGCIFGHPYDTLLYLYYKFGQNKFGDSPSRLYRFAPENSSNFLIDRINLPDTGFYPELDHCVNSRFFFNNITKPYIDPYDNEIYLPNGGHSSVSVVGFEPCEPLPLSPGWSWLAFPRLQREQNNAVPLNDVLDSNILPEDFTLGELQNRPLGSQFTYSVNWSNSQNKWLPEPYLNEIRSNLGYKLNLENPTKKRHLILRGSVLNPAWNTLINNGYQNWLGYYLPYTQFPPDAIPDEIEPDITYIFGQNWACYNDDPVGDNCIWRCVPNTGKMEVKFGDGVIIGTRTPGINFHWVYNGFPVAQMERPPSEYFSYSEQSDYTALFVEPDTANLPQEIGAFVGDSCVGATTVLPEDTLVLVQAYTEGLSGELTFQQYFGGTKSFSPKINEYFVRNNQSGRKEKRTIHTMESQDYYVISFTKQGTNDNTIKETQAWVRCSPNPVVKSCQLDFYVPTDGPLTIRLMDMFGRQKATILNGFQHRGNYSIYWSVSETSGNNIPSGLFFICMESPSFQHIAKVVIMNH